MENNLKKIYVCTYNWITLLCTWNIVSQLYLNKIYIWRENKEKKTLKEINPEYSLEGLMLKRKRQYFSYLMWSTNSLEKTLILGKIEGKRRRGWQRTWWLDSITDSTDVNLSKFQEISKDKEAWHAAVHGVAKRKTWLSNWTTVSPALGGMLIAGEAVLV